jgi:hypothetical protein
MQPPNCRTVQYSCSKQQYISISYLPDLLSVDSLNVVVNDHEAPEPCCHLRLRAQGTWEGARHHSTQQGLQVTMQQRRQGRRSEMSPLCAIFLEGLMLLQLLFTWSVAARMLEDIVMCLFSSTI